MIRATILYSLGAVLFAGLAALGVTVALDSAHDIPAMVTPCVTEDSPGPCYWEAQVQGNGYGRSFTRDARGVVVYWDE